MLPDSYKNLHELSIFFLLFGENKCSSQPLSLLERKSHSIWGHHLSFLKWHFQLWISTYSQASASTGHLLPARLLAGDRFSTFLPLGAAVFLAIVCPKNNFVHMAGIFIIQKAGAGSVWQKANSCHAPGAWCPGELQETIHLTVHFSALLLA